MGKWVAKKDKFGAYNEPVFVCDSCNAESGRAGYTQLVRSCCPVCGAEMENYEEVQKWMEIIVNSVQKEREEKTEQLMELGRSLEKRKKPKYAVEIARDYNELYDEVGSSVCLHDVNDEFADFLISVAKAGRCALAIWNETGEKEES